VRLTSRALGSLVLVTCCASRAAYAEEGVYSAYAGGGTAIALDPSATVRGSVIAQSVYGFTDAFNIEAPLLVEAGKEHAVSLGSGMEYVFHHTNHWRVNVGTGVMMRIPFDPATRVGAGPFAEGAVRWLYAWGLGLSLGVHVAFPFELTDGARSQGALIYPTLSAYQEFW
jgi:hypothetical protein